MPMYMECPVCGHRFASAFMNAYNTDMVISNFSEPCPRCGNRARGMEGSYDFDDSGEPTFLSGPEWSRDLVAEMQRRLREVDRVASSKRLTDEEARERIESLISEIEKSNPVVARTYRKYADGPSRSAWSRSAKAVAAALAAVGAYNTVADFVDRVADMVRYFGG